MVKLFPELEEFSFKNNMKTVDKIEFIKILTELKNLKLLNLKYFIIPLNTMDDFNTLIKVLYSFKSLYRIEITVDGKLEKFN